MSTENPYTAPTTDPILTQEPIAGGLQLATLSERFLGAFVDGLIGVVASIPIWGALFAFGVVNNFQDMNKVGPLYSILVGLAGFGLFVLIQYRTLKSTGQTLGKKAAKTRIVTMNGHQPAIGDLILKRYAFFQLIAIIPVVGPIASLVNILMIFKKDRRCLHDLIANTQVVKVLPGDLA